MTGFVEAALVGVVVGVLSGMLGIGGGAVMVPVNRLVFGLTALQATATSLFTIIPTSLSGCITHIRHKTCEVPLGLAAGLAGACASSLGVFLANISPSWLIMVVAAVVITVSAYNMFKKARAIPRFEKQQGVKFLDAVRMRAKAESEDMEPADYRLGRVGLTKGALIGLGAGLASGYVGVGGAFIMVPLFIGVLGLSMKHASGTSLVAVTILAIPGAIEQCVLGNVMVTIGLAMAIGSIPGAYLGATIIKFVPERMLRMFFTCVLLCAAVALVVNEFL